MGRNAFAHESGIHQDGVLKNPLNFEIMTPQSVGLSGNRLTVGKLSGRRGLQGKLKDLGFDVEGEALDAVYRAAIALADVKKEVTDADLVALVGQQAAGTTLEVPTRPWRSRAGASPAAMAAPPRATCRCALQGDEPHRRGERQRTRGRAVRRRRRRRRARPRLAPEARGLRDPGGVRRRGCPGPGDWCARAARPTPQGAVRR